MLIETTDSAISPVIIGLEKKTRTVLSLTKRTQIVQRLWNAAESQVYNIEQRLKALDSTNVQFERDARALGLLAKILKELVSIERIMDTAKNSTAEIEDQDAPPKNLEQFRYELEKRLNAMHNGRHSQAINVNDRPALVGNATG